MDLRGKSVLLTGATGGLGQAMARRLRAEGCTLTLTGRRVDVLELLATEVDGRVLAADLANPEDVDRVAAECTDVDVLVANAGVPGGGMLDSYTVEQIDRVLGVNLRSPIVLARAIGERMLARGAGHIVFMSSLSGKSTTPVTSLYNATKFGLRGFALALRADWDPLGVGVSCINPGPISDAGMFHDGGGKLPPGVRARSPEDVAAAVVRAIVHNKAEIDVADTATKVGAAFAQLAPQTAARLGKLVGVDKYAHDLAEGHKDKR
ncbi:MAG TPA: oxidoreductase [Micromonosporaceae bacterium]|nr:oxidoreductase [Micromonosporaceae bacterium]